MIENLTDLGNGRRFAAMAYGNIRYLVERRQWLVWTGKRWEIDRASAVMRHVKDTALSIYREVELAVDEDDRIRIPKHVMRSESEHRLTAMINLAKSKPEIPITLDVLDSDPWLLNCENRTIDLRKGELRPHKREDLITKLCTAEYNSGAESALLEFFLQRVLPDIGVQRYVQKALGYSICGSTELEKLFFAYGPPATAKSTLLTAVERMTGEYREESDVLRDFFEDRCVLNATAEVDDAELWKAYRERCNENGVRYPKGRKKFSQTLFERGFDQYQRRCDRART